MFLFYLLFLLAFVITSKALAPSRDALVPSSLWYLIEQNF